jgi:hypothetical protein
MSAGLAIWPATNRPASDVARYFCIFAASVPEFSPAFWIETERAISLVTELLRDEEN